MSIAYERDPAEIYRQSFAIIRAEADLERFEPAAAAVVIRMIHACGMIDLAEDVAMSADFVTAAGGALAGGAPILCDAEMVRHGIIRRLLPRDNDLICLLSEPGLSERATAAGTTRSAAQVELWGERLEGALVVIGNAPTALFRLLERFADGGPRPAAIIGVPVGFVGAAESKEELISSGHGVPYLAVRGRRGGSALAAAAVNALAGGLEGHA